MYKNKDGKTFDQWKMFIRIDEDIMAEATMPYKKHGQRLPIAIAQKRYDKIIELLADGNPAPSWVARVFNSTTANIHNIIRKGRPDYSD